MKNLPLVETSAETPHYGRRLAIVTFVAVAASISLVGLIAAPAILSKAQTRYVEVQSEINARQARAIARFAAARFDAGSSPEMVTAEVQEMLTGEDMELGYSCLVDRSSGIYISHPMQAVIGMSISTKNAEFRSINGDDPPVPVASVFADGFSGSGSLLYPDDTEEIIHMEEVPGTSWVVTTHENTDRVQVELEKLRKLITTGLIGLGIILASVASVAARLVSRRHERRIEIEQARSEAPILNILPPAISRRLKDGASVIADRHRGVTVLFADIVGFTDFAANTPSAEVVSWLDELFSEYDDICARHGLEKIKTIGDAYMLCGGLGSDSSEGVRSAVKAGLEMIAKIRELEEGETGHELAVRIGIHTGDLVAGVIGKRKIAYDIWGDVVNTAARLESAGVTNRVQISDEVATGLDGEYALDDRGPIELKGKGKVHAWLVGATT